MTRRPGWTASLIGLILALCLCLSLGLSCPQPARAADQGWDRGGPPPPTPGWPFGNVGFSLQYETWPAPYYRVTMTIKSPANIWFRYIYKDGPGPRWYHVSSGHRTKCYVGCVAIQAFGVNLSEFGPDTTKRMPWRGGEADEPAQAHSEDASGSQVD